MSSQTTRTRVRAAALACLLSASLLVTASMAQEGPAPAPDDTTPSPEEPAMLALPAGCGLSQPAFCDTFDQPAGTGNRSGQLDGTVWGVSRLTGQANLGQQQYNATAATHLVDCSGAQPVVSPPNDVIICGGQLREATNDQTIVTALAMYPKQPFDFAGRTGVVTFDVSNDEPGIHTVWPEFWLTDQPIPTPFTHFGSLSAVPRHGFGIRFAGGNCGNNPALWTADSAVVVRNYVTDGSLGPGELPAAGAVALQSLDCVTNSNGTAGSLNHVEIHVSQNQLDVYATDAGTTTPLKHIATVPNVNLSFTRGLIWIEDAHYNAHKFGGQAEHTFIWDNVGFDGPVLPRDLTFDVLDANQPTPGYPGLFNLGWSASPNNGPTVSVPGVSGISNATAGLLTFHYYASAYPTTLSYSINGNPPHTIAPPPLPQGVQTNGGYSPFAFGQPVPLSEIVAGTNTVKVSTDQAGILSNVDLVLVGAGAGATSGTPAPTATPTSVAASTPTATPTSGAAPSGSVNRYDPWEMSYAYSSAGLANPWEQVTVSATFHAPSGATLNWPGFFYGPNDYRVRFTPAEVGTYTYTVQIVGGQGGTLNDSGSFTSVASANKGFLRVTPSNPYRLMNEADGSIPYFVGMNQSWDENPDTIGVPAYSYDGHADTWNGSAWVGGGSNEITNDAMFQLYGAAGFNMLRLFPGINGLGVVAAYGAPAPGGPGNTYIQSSAKLLDQVYANAHAHGFHIQTGFFCANQGCSGGPYGGPAPVVVPSSISNHIRYMIARYGAWADVWEINNEGNASSTWAQAVTNYVHGLDPYHRMVTSSFGVAGDWNYLDAVSSHQHLGNGALADQQGDTGNFTHSRPVIVGEIYNRASASQPQGMPCDPAYHRLYDWQSFILGRVNVYWMENWQTCNMNAQTPFFGATERAWTSVLAGVANSGFATNAVWSRPSSSFTPSNNNGQGVDALSSSTKVLIYVASRAADTASYSGNVTFNFPFAATGTWIDPKTGNTVATRAVTAGSQTIPVPSFVEDIAFVATGSGGPTATPVPPTSTATPVLPTATATRTPTLPASPTPTRTPIPPATNTPGPTSTPSPAATATATSTPVPTQTDTPTAVPTATSTATPQPTDTPTPQPTDTPVPTETPTPGPGGICQVQVVYDGTPNTVIRPEQFCTDQP